jgi:excisionase family DNA binding protein
MVPPPTTPQLLAAATLMVESIARIPESQEQILRELAAIRIEIETIRRSLPPTLVPLAEAAQRLGISRSTIRRMLATKRLRSVRIGETVRVDLSSIQEALMLRASDLER